MTVYVTRKNTLFTFRDMDEDSNDQELSDNQTEQDDRNGKIKLKKTVIVGKSKDGKRGVVYLSSIAPGESNPCLPNDELMKRFRSKSF